MYLLIYLNFYFPNNWIVFFPYRLRFIVLIISSDEIFGFIGIIFPSDERNSNWENLYDSYNLTVSTKDTAIGKLFQKAYSSKTWTIRNQ